MNKKEEELAKDCMQQLMGICMLLRAPDMGDMLMEDPGLDDILVSLKALREEIRLTARVTDAAMKSTSHRLCNAVATIAVKAGLVEAPAELSTLH